MNQTRGPDTRPHRDNARSGADSGSKQDRVTGEQGPDRRRIAILGSEARRLAPLALDLIDGGYSVTMVDASAELTGAAINCAIVAARFDVGMDDSELWAHAFGGVAVLPHMANPSIVLLLAYSQSDDPSARSGAREAMAHSVEELVAEAAYITGTDLAVDAIEVAPGHDATLLEIRLRHFLRGSGTVDSGIVLAGETLWRQSIGDALSGSVTKWR
jgi:AcrR family transcriptional regulator